MTNWFTTTREMHGSRRSSDEERTAALIQEVKPRTPTTREACGDAEGLLDRVRLTPLCRRLPMNTQRPFMLGHSPNQGDRFFTG